MTTVLDASALLALLHDEPGADRVMAVLDHALISTINWSEVVQKAVGRGVPIDGMRGELSGTGLSFEPFCATQAEVAGQHDALAAHTERLRIVEGTDRSVGGVFVDLAVAVVVQVVADGR